jgi:DNA-binding CsgD family transcriptional regulator
VKTPASASIVKTTCAPQIIDAPSKNAAASPRSDVGFLLLDKFLNVVSCNREAVRVLRYPANIENLASSNTLISEEVRSRLIGSTSTNESVFLTEFASGRRRYFCRSFVVGQQGTESTEGCIAVLLERGPSRLVRLPELSQRFRLTQREQQVLEYLLQGMSSREIADRICVRPSTVKSFLRMIMIKTGVTSRSAILTKVMMG